MVVFNYNYYYKLFVKYLKNENVIFLLRKNFCIRVIFIFMNILMFSIIIWEVELFRYVKMVFGYL